jgi:hypothetical protein
MAPTFSETSALGRSAPIFTYSGSGPRTVQVTFDLHRDLMDDVNMDNISPKFREGEDYIDSLVRALQSIALPKYNLKNKAIEPPLVALRLSNEIFIKGVVTSGIGMDFTKPILSNGKYAKIDLTIEISEVDPYDATSVFKNGGFRGVVQSLKKGMNLED